MDGRHTLSLRLLLVVCTMFAIYAQHSLKTMTLEPAFWRVVEVKPKPSEETITGRPITTGDVNTVFEHICDKVKGTF